MKIAFAIPVLLAGMGLSLPAAGDRIVVICNCSVEAYGEAVQGIRAGLGREPEVVEPAALARRTDAGMYIAVGREALRAAVAARMQAPVVATMLLKEDAAAEGTPSAGEVDLDVPPRLLFPEARRLLPGRNRLAILVSGTADREGLAARAREAGFSVLLAEVAAPSDLVRTFSSLKGKADVVLALPSEGIYNSATVKPLIMASLECRLPLIGFSPNFVRAGAAAGVFPDFREIGRQTVEMALRYDPRLPRKAEPPRKLAVAVNQKVLRLLGVDYGRADDVVVYR